jgi:hypothetical protein
VTQSSHILNKGRRYFGVKSEMLILGEPPYTRPVRTVVGEAHRGLIAHGRLLDVCCELRKQRNCNKDGSRPSDQVF